MSKWLWIIKRLQDQLISRVILYGLLAAMVALIGVFFGRYLPEGWAADLGAEAVEPLLRILATSMLAVTTFSLTVMVNSFSTVSSNATPRSTALLASDDVSQSALATFLGSFIFSIVGLLSLSIGGFPDGGRTLLFIATVLVLLLVVGTLMRWIDYLSRLGRLSHIIELVEKATKNALEDRLRKPCLGAGVIPDDFDFNKSSLKPQVLDELGYVQSIDVGKLSEIAKAHEGKIYLELKPGNFNGGAKPAFYLEFEKEADEASLNSMKNCFFIGQDRSFQQDPRYGFVVLSEIASRALSPAVNDPGTAIQVINSVQKLLIIWMKRNADKTEKSAENVFMQPVFAKHFLEDGFAPIARDGAGFVEVGQRLQQALSELHLSTDRKEDKTALEVFAQEAIERAKNARLTSSELEKLKNLCFAEKQN